MSNLKYKFNHGTSNDVWICINSYTNKLLFALIKEYWRIIQNNSIQLVNNTL